MRMIVNTVMANLRTKLWEMSQMIHRSRTASSNISTTWKLKLNNEKSIQSQPNSNNVLFDYQLNGINKKTRTNTEQRTEIQMNAVKNNRRRMMVRGKMAACSPPISSRSTRLQASDVLYPTSISSWYWNEKQIQSKIIQQIGLWYANKKWFFLITFTHV